MVYVAVSYIIIIIMTCINTVYKKKMDGELIERESTVCTYMQFLCINRLE